VARTYSADAKPLVSRGYGKIVFFTLMAMLIGVGLMGWEIYAPTELGGYGGATQAVRKQPVKVPAALPPVEKGPPARATGPVVPPEMP